MDYKNIFDTHAHYGDERFNDDREELLAALPGKGVSLVMEAGCSLPSSRQGVEFTRKYPYFYCAVGIHPQDAGTVSEEDGYLEILASLAKEKKVKAIGEIGLDYHYLDYPRELQKTRFEEQLALANDLNLPVIIHDRDAHKDSLDLINKYRPKGVFHCFSGSREMALELVKRGMYLGFTGVLTFSNARRALEAVEAVPIDRLLLETDCPYMAPVPFRGQRCDSSLIPCHAEVMARIKGVSVQEMLDIANENGRRLFEIDTTPGY